MNIVRDSKYSFFESLMVLLVVTGSFFYAYIAWALVQ